MATPAELIERLGEAHFGEPAAGGRGEIFESALPGHNGQEQTRI
jgi:hypothetical protein